MGNNQQDNDRRWTSSTEGSAARPLRDISSAPEWSQVGELRNFEVDEGFAKREADPEAFTTLPKDVVMDIGLRTHMGARIDAAVLAGFAFHGRNNQSRECTLTYHDGQQYACRVGEFVVSTTTVAEDLFYRWFLSSPESEHFNRFYERIKKARERLSEKGFLRRLGYALEKKKGTRGTRWTFEGTPLESALQELRQCPFYGKPVTRPDPDIEQMSGNSQINVVDMLASPFVDENPKMFTRSEMVTSLTKKGRGRYHDYINWVRTVARRGAAGERHISVGAWKRGEEGRMDKPVHIPYVVFDVDGADPLDSHQAALNILDCLDFMEVDLKEVLCVYTGGRGFHIRLPSGMLGNPVLEAGEAQQVLRRFADIILDEPVDPAEFNPKQNVRLVGGTHPDTGRYAIGWYGEEFLQKGIEEILRSSAEYRPILLKDPRQVKPELELVMRLLDATDTADMVGNKEFLPDWNDTKALGEGSSQVIQRALEGVEQGEVWWDGEKVHAGRNKAAFIVACHFLREFKGNVNRAKEVMAAWNHKNEPSLPARELEGRVKSAVRTLTRQQRR